MKRKAVLWIIILIMCVAVVVTLIVTVHSGFNANISAYGESKLKNLALNIMNSSISEVLAKYDNMDKLLNIEKDASGHITMLSVDSALMNDISVDAALLAGEKISCIDESQVSIPLGNLIGAKILSGYGPKIPIKFQPLGAVSTNFYTELEEVGINQASYRVYIVLKCYMQMIVGQSKHTVEAETNVLISEAIVVGVVPDTYANIPSETDFMNLTP